MAKEQAEMSVFELEELGRSSRSSFRLHGSMSRRNSSIGSAREGDDEYELQWAAIERLETFERVRKSVVDGDSSENQKEKKVADVTKLGAPERRLLIEKLIKNIENDNLRLLQKQRVRIDRVNVEVPTIEVRYKNLSVEAECEVVKGKPLPTLWNAVKGIFSGLAKVPGLKSEEAKITILSDVSGIIKPSRKVTGEISYNGFRLEEFVPEKTAAYVSQYDLHIPEMTVREILDFSARFQGVGSRAEIMKEVSRREKQAGIIPEPDIDTYMKAISVEGLERSLQTDYILKIMGLDICADTMIGDVMRRGISGGQKKRLTTECGFKCPKRKGEAEFLQEVLSRKDQEQYWSHPQEPYHYVSVNQFREKFKASIVGHKLEEDLSKPYDKSQCHESALSFSIYSLAKWELFKACMARELLLMKRNSFVYIFKTTQLSLTAIITMTVFLRTRLGVDVFHANSYLGALFYTLIINMVNGFPELAMTVSRLPVLYKQRDFYFYPAWAYAIPAFLLKFPISLIESLVWTSITYYGIGYSPEAVRFFRQFLLLLVVHQMSLSLFRFLASYFQTVVASSVSGTLSLLVLLVFGGFILPHHSMPGWLKWGFWCSPLSYAEIGLAVNEFLAPRWGKISSANTTIGKQVLTSRGLDFNGYFYWISVGALVGYILLLNVGFTLAITLRKPPVASRAIISREKLSQIKREEGSSNAMDLKNISKDASSGTSAENRRTGRMVLPFVPLTVAFRDIQYYVETPLEMREQGHAEKRLQLLHNITGAFRPGILSALMGVSGAGKTTLLDVLAGRKTGGTIEGGITIGGYPKVQQTFARISGYCEQSDIHSPHITVEESVIYSAWLRLPSQVDRTTRSDFVDEVLETIELDGIKDSLVGIPGITGLSTEQRKRLTIAVELVANPSIIFMDEPTSGLDARAAAIVMRAVKNVVGTGRTVVCTIHQPSTDIFEAFDELILMKRGGELIYAGPLGQHSTKVIEYFEGIAGIPRIRNNYNPATWMLEVTSTSVEAQLNVDFAQIYKSSSLYRDNQELVKQLSKPAPDSAELHFPTRFPQNGWAQFKACLWKQYLSYWRSPSYNLVRLIFITISSTVFAVLFWKHGNTINNQQDLFNIFGLLYITTNFFGINNSSSVLTFVATERTVLYRERYAGMYSPWAYSFAQMVIEIPYVFIQVGLFMVIIYPAIGFYWSAYKFLWFFFTMFCTLLYFVYLGMLIVSLTPNVQVASILQSPCYALLNLFSGFMVPSPQIPKWWIWFYYINPMAWTINSLLTSQYGDVDKEIMVFGEVKSISSFIKDYFGYHHDHQGFVAVILIAYPLIFGCLFAYCIEKLNFQRR
ncbi:uncharacterized protein A4U43_C08F29430 [Asparagus officinalis]|nr:uncharacterized protein A4U43_C08F29430 [Asparagus officinalis]